MLFSDRRRHSVVLPAKDQDGKPSTIASLIHHLCEHVMEDTRKELFVLQDHLYVSHRPLPPLAPLSSQLRSCWPGKRGSRLGTVGYDMDDIVCIHQP